MEAGTRDDVAVSPASLNGAALPITAAAAWDDITGKPATFPPTVPIDGSDITGFVRITVASTAPSSPAVNDVWIDTT